MQKSIFDTNDIRKIGIQGGDSWLLESSRQMIFFIGPNNCGKSRKVRWLYRVINDSLIFDFKNSALLGAIEEIELILGAMASGELPPYSVWILDMDIQKLIDKLASWKDKPLNLIELRKEILSSCVKYGRLDDFKKRVEWSEKFASWLKNRFKISDIDGIHSVNSPKNWSKLYIPILRGLRGVSSNDVFAMRTESDYFSDLDETEFEIFTGHDLYKELVEQLLGSYKKRQKVRDYEKYLSENFFFGNDISLVPMADKDVVYVKEGDDQDRPIYDLGDGIQSIILLTYKVFMAEQPTMFFIEEPEQHLHAGLQRTLVETFARHKQHMFFMTTHSNNFLDLAQERDDVSIQQVRRENGETVVQPSLDYGKTLAELGVRASSVLLANCSIWVEGITDKYYLRAFLKKYIDDLKDKNESSRLKSFHENLHYVFVEYQGSNITHWDFSDQGSDDQTETPAKRLNRNILLIADNDIDGKGERIKTLEEALEDAFHLLKYKEIENHIPFNILIKTAKKRWKSFNQTDGCSIEKMDNLTEEHFKSTENGIGVILEDCVDKPDDLKRDFYATKSGTIKDKVKFCQTAVAIMQESEDWRLTLELELLCEKIWVHVTRHN